MQIFAENDDGHRYERHQPREECAHRAEKLRGTDPPAETGDRMERPLRRGDAEVEPDRATQHHDDNETFGRERKTIDPT